jgi:hydroxymethylglutaryl-CoA reductase
MQIVWKLSSDKFTNAEVFPLPVINIVSNYATDDTIFICANKNLRGKEILQNSRVYKQASENVDRLVEVLVYYVNPVTNSIIGYYVDVVGEIMVYAIDNGVFDFALSSMPAFKITLHSVLKMYEQTV